MENCTETYKKKLGSEHYSLLHFSPTATSTNLFFSSTFTHLLSVYIPPSHFLLYFPLFFLFFITLLIYISYSRSHQNYMIYSSFFLHLPFSSFFIFPLIHILILHIYPSLSHIHLPLQFFSLSLDY